MRYILLFTLLLMTGLSFSQYTLTGKITNDHNEALVGSTVVLLDKVDSSMVAFSLTNDHGIYKLEDVEQGEYIIQVSYIGHANYSQVLDIDWSQSEMSIGDILLAESSEIIQEITIKAEHIPMGIRGDTISYNASAFKTRPNATVEDLLRKLPGIEVERNGNIKAQGEDVENVLVDGKEFFGGDPTMATKNLEAEAVDKVEVYDKKSEMAEFTGIDDGKDEKTINLKLKEDHKNGGFGTADVAGGTSKSYTSKLNYFRFSPSMQASVILAANNVNKETFTINDRIDFMGGITNAMSNGVLNLSEYQGLQDGLNSSLSAGSNFNYSFSPKIELKSFYVLNRYENRLNQRTDLLGFGDDFDYMNMDTLSAVKENIEHQLNTSLSYKINPLTELIFKNNFNLGYDNRSRNSLSRYFKEDIDQGQTMSDFIGDGNSFGFDSNTLLKRNFLKKGRSLIGSITYKRNSDESIEDIVNRNQLAGNNSHLNQYQTYNSLQEQVSASANYTEPLGQRIFLGAQYEYGISNESPLRNYYDIISSQRILNTDLSAEYRKTYAFHVGGLNLRRNTKKSKMNIGLKAQFTNLKGAIQEFDLSIANTYRHLLPSFSIEHEMKGGKSISINYLTSIAPPQLDQLLPLPDNTTANFQYIGNVDLDPEYNHRLGLGFHLFDNFNLTNLNLSINANYTKNKIVYRTDIDDNLFRTVQPINTDSYKDLSTYLGFSRPFKPLKIDYRIRSRVRLANYNSFVNGLESKVNDNNYNLKLSLSNRKTDYFYVETGVTLDMNTRKYGINPAFNQTYFNTNYFLEIEGYLPQGLTLNSEVNYRKFSAESFSDSPSYLIWDVSLRKLFLGDRLEVSLSANDLLKQNIGYKRQGNTNSIQQIYFDNLSRYFMLGMSYKIGKGRSDGGIRIDMD